MPNIKTITKMYAYALPDSAGYVLCTVPSQTSGPSQTIQIETNGRK